MKKIFAIALAAVMVLSMASAFAASDCFVWGNDWPCAADDNTPWCGKGKVEIVPLVKVNTACGWEYQVNTCAGAVRSDEIYYAVKLTVEAYPDRDWWDVATLAIEDWDEEAVANGVELDPAKYVEVATVGAINMKAKKEIVYYAAVNDNEFNGWIELSYEEKADKLAADALGNADEALDLKDVAFEMAIPSPALACGDTWADYQLCATLASFYDGASNDDFNKLGDYYYSFGEPAAPANYKAIEDADPTAFTGDLLIFTLEDEDDPTSFENFVVFEINKGAIGVAVWFFDEDQDGENDFKDNDKFYNKVMEDFGFNSCGTAACVTQMNIFKNFGWNDEFESCTPWSDKAAAVVDAECVVAIPKTGDASLLAWLF